MNFNIKQKFFLVTFLFTICLLQAQLITRENPNPTGGNSLAFIDGSSNPGYNVSGANYVGKGILYPSMDLTAALSGAPFDSGNVGAAAYNPNHYDGLVVYNTGTGAVTMGTSTEDVSPGFYYYSNNTATTITWNTGTWVPLGGGGSAGKFIDGNTATDAVYTAGKVGINTPSPDYPLTVNGTIKGNKFYAEGLGDNSFPIDLKTADNTNEVYMAFRASGDFLGSVIGSTDFTDGNLVFKTGNGEFVSDLVNAMTILGNGRVGIGTPTPTHKLEVNGTAQIRGDVNTTGKVGIGTTTPTNTLHINGNDAGINISDNDNAGNNLALKMYHGGASGKGMGLIWNDNTSPDGAMVIQTLNSTGGFISNLHSFARNGNVGIGTVSPTQRLHVSGNILASGTITPDYVFEKYYEGESALKTDYKMLTLSEIEAFTRKHKHLPGVPSAKEVEDKGGILINRATEINLEKIEELYLHIIEQQQLIKKLELRIENLEQIK